MTNSPEVQLRAQTIFEEASRRNHLITDRLFLALNLAQWAFAVLLAVTLSPFTWEGSTRSVHPHVGFALGLGGLLAAGCAGLVKVMPGSKATRLGISAIQLFWSSLLIHLTGGRIETHFHVFGSLAFLAFYRDWTVLLPATVLTAVDHLVRQLFWPESVYGIPDPAWWRFLEHAGWVVFEDIILVFSCVLATREMRAAAAQQAELEALSEREQKKSLALDAALQELRSSQESQLRVEKLAAVGQLAASVGHELRNPLSAVGNALAYVTKRLPAEATADPRIPDFLRLMQTQLDACGRIISDLLDFARERPPTMRPCALHAIAQDAIALVPARPNVRLHNDVLTDLPLPMIDAHQFRQVLTNLMQNAAEAIPADRPGQVRVWAEGGGPRPWQVRVADDGEGIPAEVIPKIFQPLFTTKTRGTGLGLAIVAQIVRRHGGEIRVRSQVGRGTEFTIELPINDSALPV